MEGPDGIDVPKEFVDFAQIFFFDGDDPSDMTVEDLIIKSIGWVEAIGGKISVLANFLDRLLGGSATDAILDEIWHRAEPIYPMRANHRASYEEFRKAAHAWVQAHEQR